MNEKRLDALRKLLPEWKFRRESIGPRMMMLPPGEDVWQCIGYEHGGVVTAMYNDHLCGEIYRALFRLGYIQRAMMWMDLYETKVAVIDSDGGGTPGVGDNLLAALVDCLPYLLEEIQ